MGHCFLTEQPSQDHDRALREDEFAEVWRRYETFVRRCASKALSHASLHRAARYAGANGENSHLLAGVGAVRRALACGDADIIDDILQEVAVALLTAIRAKPIRASASVLEAWFRTAVPRIAGRTARERAVLLFAAGDANPSEDYGAGREPEEVGTSHDPDPDWLADAKRLIGEARELLPRLPQPLERTIVEAWLSGDEPGEIAENLGMNPATVRTKLFRALKCLIDALRPRDGPGGGCPVLAAFADCHVCQTLLTFLNTCAILLRSGYKGALADKSVVRQPSKDPLAGPGAEGIGSIYRHGADRGAACSSLKPGPWRTMATSSIDRSIFVGSAEDPQPVFREEAKDAASWPEGAVMAVTFARERYPHIATRIRSALPRTDYFGIDGWPVDLGEDLKRILSTVMKLEFQVHPWGWRDWTWEDGGGWDEACESPQLFRRCRGQAGLAHAMVTTAGAFAPNLA